MTIKSQPFSWSRILLNQTLKTPTNSLLSRKISTLPHFPTSQTPQFPFSPKTHFSLSSLLLNDPLKTPQKPHFSFSRKISTLPHFPTNQTPKSSYFSKTHFSTASSRAAQDLLAEVEREKQREREARRRAGLDSKDIDEENEEDYMNVGPLIEKLEKEKLKDTGDLNMYEEPTDSDSDDDERFAPDAVRKKFEVFEKKFKRHEELLKNFTDAGK